MSRKISEVAYRKPNERAKALDARRNGKMAQSAESFIRGSTESFYEWLQSDAAIHVPQGPAVWICGDCHLGNLGPLADCDGHIELQMRDFDQTVIGNPAHDLIRLGLSLANIARGSDLPGIATAVILEEMTEGYAMAFENDSRSHLNVKVPAPVQAAMDLALKRRWKGMAKEDLENAKPTLPLGEKFWPLSREERSELVHLIKENPVHDLVCKSRSAKRGESIEILDAAYWVKGCSSLGRLRYAVLLGIGKKNDEFRLIDIKEAVRPKAPHHGTAKAPKNNAKRVIEGASHLSPALGDRMLAAQLLGRSVFLRELMPQDLKLEIQHLTRDEAKSVARYLAWIVGKAHARQMQYDTREKWHKSLRSHSTESRHTPSWLWSSVVDLQVAHERAYLEHCRSYALKT